LTEDFTDPFSDSKCYLIEAISGYTSSLFFTETALLTDFTSSAFFSEAFTDPFSDFAC